MKKESLPKEIKFNFYDDFSILNDFLFEFCGGFADYEFYLSVFLDLVKKNKASDFVISWLELIKFFDEKERNNNNEI